MLSFIPNRDGTDIHSAFQLLPETSAESSAKARVRRPSHGQGTDAEARRGMLGPLLLWLL